MIVRFATTCDHCGARSEEYTAWPSCSECLLDTCPDCMEPGSLDPGDGDRGDRCCCHTCAGEIREGDA